MLGLSFFSGRRTKTFANSGKSITNGQWTSYFIASVKNNPLLRFIYDGLNECYHRAGKIEEYYTMDYLFAIAIRHSDKIRQMIENVPEINANLFSLEEFMNRPWDAKMFSDFMQKAPFYKLNHRVPLQQTDSHGRETMFGHLCQLFELS